MAKNRLGGEDSSEFFAAWAARIRARRGCGASCRAVLFCLPFGIAACSNVHNVALGQASPPFGPFGTPYALSELGSPCQNPTLTSDLLELYFTSDRTGSVGKNDTWVAKRTSVDEAFGAPELVPVVNSSGEESSPAISADGLTLWFASNRSGGAGGMDIWSSIRADRNATWSDPKPVSELNTTGDDLPRPVGNHDLQMPISSHAAGAEYQLMMATRASSDAPWIAPVPIAELANPAMSRVDGFLTDDGTLLLFNDELPDSSGSEIKRTWRLTRDDAFANPVSVGSDLNGVTLNRDPWLSPDGNRFIFSSDRSGTFEIYEADLDHDP